MTRRIILLSMGCAAGVAVLTFSVARLGRAQPGSQGWKEFSIRWAEKSTSLLSGNVRAKTVIEAQRADGSKVTAELSTDAAPAAVLNRSIRSVPNRRDITVNDTLAVMTTLYDLAGLPYRPPPADPQCGFSKIAARLKPQLKGEEQLWGFRTVIMQTEDGPFLMTVWKAPDLNCETLKMTEDKRDGLGGTVAGRFELETTSLTLGPPDPALFEVPATYAEISPIQMAKARAAKEGRTVPDKVLQRLERRENKYIENHRRAGK